VVLVIPEMRGHLAMLVTPATVGRVAVAVAAVGPLTLTRRSEVRQVVTVEQVVTAAPEDLVQGVPPVIPELRATRVLGMAPQGLMGTQALRVIPVMRVQHHLDLATVILRVMEARAALLVMVAQQVTADRPEPALMAEQGQRPERQYPAEPPAAVSEILAQ
jgi:hypothetical protein